MHEYLEAKRVAHERAVFNELAEAAADYARLTMVERFPLEDIAVGAAYERLRKALTPTKAPSNG